MPTGNWLHESGAAISRCYQLMWQTESYNKSIMANHALRHAFFRHSISTITQWHGDLPRFFKPGLRGISVGTPKFLDASGKTPSFELCLPIVLILPWSIGIILGYMLRTKSSVVNLWTQKQTIPELHHVFLLKTIKNIPKPRPPNPFIVGIM